MPFSTLCNTSKTFCIALASLTSSTTTNIILLVSNARLHVGPRNLPLIESILELGDRTVEVRMYFACWLPPPFVEALFFLKLCQNMPAAPGRQRPKRLGQIRAPAKSSTVPVTMWTCRVAQSSRGCTMGIGKLHLEDLEQTHVDEPKP